MSISRQRLTVGWLALPALLMSAACATTSTRQLQLDPEVVEAERAKQRQLALERQFTYQDRLDDLAWPILESATPLCEEDIAPRIGFQFSNRHLFEEEWQEAAEAVGLGDTVEVVAVARGSAADRAGMKAGDHLVKVDEWPVPTEKEAVSQLSKRLATVTDTLEGDLDFVITRDGARRTIQVAPVRTCDYPTQVVRSSALNAFADGDRIYVTSTMMRFAENDELQVVLAHELAHNAMGHVGAKKQNAILGGVLGAVVDVLAATQGVNTGGAFTSQGIDQGVQAHSQDFEREADYVGLYAMAIAGLPLEDAPEFWRHMAQENPESIDFASTHPTSAERFVRMERAVEEILEKREKGVPLRPEMKEEEEN